MRNFLKKLFSSKDTTETISDQIVEDTATATNANSPNVSPLYSITATGSGGGIGGGIITGGIVTGVSVSGGGVGGGGVTYAPAPNYTNGKVFSASGSGSFTSTFGILAGETVR